MSITNCYAGLFARLPSLWQHYTKRRTPVLRLSITTCSPLNSLWRLLPPPPLPTPLALKMPQWALESPLLNRLRLHRPQVLRPRLPLPLHRCWTVLWIYQPPLPTKIKDKRTPTVPSQSLPDPLTGNADTPAKITPLLHYLHKHLTPHLQALLGTNTRSCFVTLIIGPSTDSRVGSALHSHLVCAAVAPPTEDYSVLFIPSNLIHDFQLPH